MSNKKEIKDHIQSIEGTRKLTNAMYLISSTKLQKARRDLNETRPYFDELSTEIKRIFRNDENINSPYFYPISGEHEFPGYYGYLVISSDRGLAGQYNKAVFKETQRLLSTHDKNLLFILGESGRHHYMAGEEEVDENFNFLSQDPSLHRAREIRNYILDLYDRGKIKKLFIIYTDYRSSIDIEARSYRLLPFHRSSFISDKEEKEIKQPFEFLNSMEYVLNHIVPSYLTGFIYSALVDSFCSEQSARMMAMDGANKNAKKLLDDLNVIYNHARQGSITQEITEISASAQAQRKSKEIKR